jgi:uncharacterized repeat protein (TIGR02543 family)
MKKFIKICFIFSLIFLLGGLGETLSNSTPNTTHDFLLTEIDISTTSSSTPPEKYDLRDYIYIDVENQNPFGICYAYASLSSLETYLALNYGEYYDFSELHFSTALSIQDNYYPSVLDALNDGGNFSHFALYTQKDKSLVIEDLMPMSKYRSMKNSQLTTSLTNDFNKINENFYSLVKVNSTKSYPQYVGNKSAYNQTELSSFRNNIKQHLMKYGALTAGIHSDIYFNFNTINYCVKNDSLIGSQNEINKSINHLITIVGWDDNYDANGLWQNKGAYICLNSWGEDFGDNGYFYVSYDDYFIESCIQGVTDATLSTTNKKISTISTYQDQTSIFTHVYNDNLRDTVTANIIDTSNNIGETITHIDSYIQGNSTRFYIKFFNSKQSALTYINSANTPIGATKIDDLTFGPRYELTSPITITDNYMVIVREVKQTKRYYSLGGDKDKHIGIEPCYSYQGTIIGHFDTSAHIWSPTVSGRELDLTIPVILHLNTPYVKVSAFDSNVLAFTTNSNIKNNAIFVNKSMQITLSNFPQLNQNLNNITIKTLDGNDITSLFKFSANNDILSINMISSDSNNFKGLCLLSIPCEDDTIYRVIEIQDVATFKISYNLYGGVANNPSIYTNKQSILTLNEPTKPGYVFNGWFIDAEFTTPFDSTNLTYRDITLYAKYDFAHPSIISKTANISTTYYKDMSIQISVDATHTLLNEYNTLSYQWYKSDNLNGIFTPLNGENQSYLLIESVSQSGYYACEITINITDTNLTSTPISKTLNIVPTNAISVNIQPYIYDMSNVVWNYTDAFSYDSNIHTVELNNLPIGVSASYENNSNSQIGLYTASAIIDYDDMNGNAIISSKIEDLHWQIRKAKITITIDDIYSKEQLSTSALQQLYSCTIENEYLPSDIITLQDKISYLNLQYILLPTDNNYSKIISASTDSFDIYDITIIDAEYRVIINNLTSNNITANNNKGFVKDCMFNASSHQISADTTTLLEQQNLVLVNAYDLNFSYLKEDKVTITIPTTTKQLLNGLSVYMLKNGKLTKLDTTINSNQICFETTEMEASYLIVKEDLTSTSNSQMLIIVLIISTYIGLCIYVIISKIKNRF